MCNFLLLLLSLIPLVTLGTAFPKPAQNAHVTVVRKPLETWMSIVDDTKPTHSASATNTTDPGQVSSTPKLPHTASTTHIDASQLSSTTTKPTHTIIHVDRDQASSTESLVSSSSQISVSFGSIFTVFPPTATSVVPVPSPSSKTHLERRHDPNDVAHGDEDDDSNSHMRRQLLPYVALGDGAHIDPHFAFGNGNLLKVRQLDPHVAPGAVGNA